TGRRGSLRHQQPPRDSNLAQLVGAKLMRSSKSPLSFHWPKLFSVCLALGFWLLGFGFSASGGPVVDLITQARIAGSEDVDADVSARAIEMGLRELAPSDAIPSDREAIVSDALYIVIHRTETDDVLGGLMRGLAIIRESTNTDIVSTLC